MSRPALAKLLGAHASDVAPPFDDENIEDDRLRLIFTRRHRALARRLAWH
jgi:predicted RNA polymerase sigma factor